MVNKTPLRLVAIEETPPPEEDREGAPVRVIPEHEAITRRVEAAAAIAAHDASPEKPKRRTPTWHAIVPAAAVVVVLGAVAIGLLSKGGKTSTPTATKAAPVVQPATPKPVEVVPPSPAVAAVPAAAAPAAVPAVAKAAAETIRLQITAEPVEAVLSLDGNTLAGHRLNLEVPKDRGIHVVSASAPGYLPINQQVSFSGDVVLTISLRRSHTPAPARQSARSQRAAAEPKAKAPARAPNLEPSRPSLEPGMHLDGPAVRANAKPIDERNPYAP